MPSAAREALPKYRIVGCASQGNGSGDEARLSKLLSGFEFELAVFRKPATVNGFKQLLHQLRTRRCDLFLLEGTGVAAGSAAILGKLLWNKCYVVSSGDAVGPFLSARMPWAAPVFWMYERLLYSMSSGFIGWTPYLVGRALTMGAGRGVTIPGWAATADRSTDVLSTRKAIRERLGISQDAVVIGIVGALNWSNRYNYCYGMDLVRAAALSNGGASVLIVGDGSGLEHLKRAAGAMVGCKVFFTGHVAREEVGSYVAAMDVGSMPQSVDGVGNFRYTTKLLEYRAAGLLIVTNHIPAAYDLDRGDFLRISGASPWSKDFISQLAEMMSALDPEQVAHRRAQIIPDDIFEPEHQVARATAFLQDVIASCQGGASGSS